jgi:acyl-coenzyme A thioesterase PaaI-like protein
MNPPPENALSIQERYAPRLACFGCGPANEKGLRIRCFEQGDEVVAEWRASPHHEAYPGMLNGGIAGTLLDCLSAWTAAVHLMRRRSADTPPCTVTAEYAVRFLRPMPTSGPIELSARAVESTEAQAVVAAKLSAGGRLCATCRGTFVAVADGHPAYHRW